MNLIEQLEGSIALICRRIASIETRLEAVGSAGNGRTQSGLSNQARSEASAAQRRRALELQQAGLKPSQIARQLQISERTVHRYFRSVPVPGHSKPRK